MRHTLCARVNVKPKLALSPSGTSRLDTSILQARSRLRGLPDSDAVTAFNSLNNNLPACQGICAAAEGWDPALRPHRDAELLLAQKPMSKGQENLSLAVHHSLKTLREDVSYTLGTPNRCGTGKRKPIPTSREIAYEKSAPGRCPRASGERQAAPQESRGRPTPCRLLPFVSGSSAGSRRTPGPNASLSALFLPPRCTARGPVRNNP
jgi:hypothetical protein